MRAGLAIKQEAEAWLRAGEGNEPIRGQGRQSQGQEVQRKRRTPETRISK